MQVALPNGDCVKQVHRRAFGTQLRAFGFGSSDFWLLSAGRPPSRAAHSLIHRLAGAVLGQQGSRALYQTVPLEVAEEHSSGKRHRENAGVAVDGRRRHKVSPAWPAINRSYNSFKVDQLPCCVAL